MSEINANLTAGIDLTKARRLKANLGISFKGTDKSGPFELDPAIAASMLAAPNPDGRPNSDVVRPWANGLDIGGRPRGLWIVDFGTDMPEEEAALYEAPFEYVRAFVRPKRIANPSEPRAASAWWLHQRPRPDLRAAISGLRRYVATVRHSKYRLFVWLAADTVPDSALVVFARDDDFTFGVLHSRIHEVWARGTGTQVRDVESGFRYTPTTCFETFPFPHPTDTQRDAIADGARDLDRLRTGWLNPPGLSDADLAKRTLTNLYNARPTWLAQAHGRLDAAVLAAYGWPADIDREELLAKLLALNLSRAGDGEKR